MNGKNLFRALEYVDDRYLDMVDAAAQEATDMKQKHFSGRKTILYILAAAICVSLLTVTAAAAGWIPNIFAAAQPKATPRDEPVLEAAQSATQSQTPETVEFAEADYTKFTLFQSYYDGNSIALGYDLSGVMPGETVVGFTAGGYAEAGDPAKTRQSVLVREVRSDGRHCRPVSGSGRLDAGGV